MTNSWFALRVKSRREKVVSHLLNRKGFEQFLPVYRSKRKWTDRVREVDVPLFPGYVFCRFSPESRVPVVTTPGVVDIVRCGRMLAPVDPAEIAALQAQIKPDDRSPELYFAIAPKITRLLDPYAFRIATRKADDFLLNREIERNLGVGTTPFDRKDAGGEGKSVRGIARAKTASEANLN